jgi:drug/metabolite transporter (DMT)-like permease
MKRGLLFALLATLFWGAQPLAIGVVIQKIPPATLSFYKIISAAVVLTIILFQQDNFPNYKSRGPRALLFLFLCALAMATSFVLYSTSYLYISAVNTQFYLQLSRILLALAGIFIFHETFKKIHWFGLILVCFGFWWFFQDQSGRSASTRGYGIGALLMILASVAWAKFAIFQKILLKSFSPLQILAFIYLVSTLLLLPFAVFNSLTTLTGAEWLALGFICLSNLGAYAFFSEALKFWDASRVGIVSCLTPVITLVLSLLTLKPEHLGLYGVAGGSLIIAGSILVSLPVQR